MQINRIICITFIRISIQTIEWSEEKLKCTATYSLVQIIWEVMIEKNKFFGNFFRFVNFTMQKIYKLYLLICRLPSKSDTKRRAQWIGVITKHQQFDENLTVFNICSRHFDESEIYIRGNEKVLKSSAIPTIFDERKNNSSLNDNFEELNKGNNSQNECDEKCKLLQTRVAELEKEISNLKLRHDIEIQRMKINSENSRKTQSNRLKDTRKELSKQKSKLLQLEDVIKDLQEQRYISPDDAKFLNVSSKSIFFLFKRIY